MLDGWIFGMDTWFSSNLINFDGENIMFPKLKRTCHAKLLLAKYAANHNFNWDFGIP